MNNLEKLIQYFTTNHKNKVFYTELRLSDGRPGLLYLYDQAIELENFMKSFGYYLPIYIKNEDNISTMDFNDDIDEKLAHYSKIIWSDSKTMPHRNTNVNGIFGELFLDIYLRIVKNRKLLISYASKRSFNINIESRGIDSIGYIFNNNKIELYLCEAKFVSNIGSAKSELLADIINGHSINNKGVNTSTTPHLCESFLNDYFNFVLEQEMSCPKDDRERIKAVFNEINKKINDPLNPKTFIEIILEMNIKVHFICFAIFRDFSNHPDVISSIYSELLASIDSQFATIGITNKSSEVVFIPTKNTSIDIKEAIESFYG